MQRHPQKEQLLQNTAKEPQLSIQNFIAELSQPDSLCHPSNKEIIPNNDKTSHSLIQDSSTHTFQSPPQQNACLQTLQKSYLSEIPETPSPKNQNQPQPPIKPVNHVEFYLEDRHNSQFHFNNSQNSKDLQLEAVNQKKSIDPSTQIQQLRTKTLYNSSIKQKSVCQECITRMHQMHQMEFLKNKYHREYVSLRTELEKLKSEFHENESQQTPRSSINLIELYGDHNTEQKSQKSSFSFENIQNALLSERFALEIEQCIKLIDKLLPLERKFIQLSSEDFKLLMELQIKTEKLKAHLGLDTEPKYLEDLFNELQKSELTIKKIHQKYKKLIEKIYKVQKQKTTRVKNQFNEVSNKFMGVLVNLADQKTKNQKLKTQIAQLKAQLTLQQFKQPKSISLTSSHQIKPSSFKQNLKDSQIQQNANKKQKDLHDTSSSQCEKTSTVSDGKVEKQLQKIQAKLKNSEKYCKSLQKTIKQQKSQISSMKKKYLNDFNQFMNSIILQKHLRLRSIGQQTDKFIPPSLQEFFHVSENQLGIMGQISTQKMIEQIGGLVYEIFSYTSWENDDGENMFQPQNEGEILEMLRHIKKFAHKFDEWQKEKQKQVNEFQKNFLQLLKFFIDSYKVSEQKLLQQISKLKDNEPLAIYIKRYYSKVVELSENEERESSSFTFGQKSQSHKDSQEP